MSLPTPPLRSDGPATFADRGDTFMAALPAFETEMNALGAQVAIDAAAVIAAAPGAVAAANFKGEYAAGTTYQIGQSVSYGGDTWFAKTINTGTTPVSGVNWQRAVAIPNQTGQAGKVLVTDGNVLSWVNKDPGIHSVTVHSGNGKGSGTNSVRRFTTVKSSVGTDITYADSAVNGASFTINSPGLYAIFAQDTGTAQYAIGVTVNAPNLAVSATAVPTANLLSLSTQPASAINSTYTASMTVRLNASDVIRLFSAANTTSSYCYFSIIKVGL